MSVELFTLHIKDCTEIHCVILNMTTIIRQS